MGSFKEGQIVRNTHDFNNGITYRFNIKDKIEPYYTSGKKVTLNKGELWRVHVVPDKKALALEHLLTGRILQGVMPETEYFEPL